MAHQIQLLLDTWHTWTSQFKDTDTNNYLCLNVLSAIGVMAAQCNKKMEFPYMELKCLLEF